jgi:hypothetical protein
MKLTKRQKKEIIKKHELETPPPYTEGHWDEFMLEENSFYDIDMLEKYNAPIKEEIKYWEEEFKPSGNMGKWWASLQINKLKKKLKRYQ